MNIMTLRFIAGIIILTLLASWPVAAEMVQNTTYIPSELSRTTDIAIAGSITPKTAEMGSPFSSSIILANYGPAKADDIQIDYYLVRYNVTDARPVWVHQKTADFIPPFYQDIVSFTATVPDGIEPGLYVLYATVSSSTMDRNDTNNHYLSHQPVEIKRSLSPSSTGRSDLIVTIDSVSALEIAPDYPFTINYTISNQGNLDAGTFHVGFYLSSDPVIQPADLKIWDEIYYHAYPGMSASGVSTDILPADIPSGDYYLGAIIDFTHMIQESDEENNEAIYQDTFHVTDKRTPIDENFLSQVSGYLVEKSNLYRQYRHLPNLSYDLSLGDIAISHSTDMAARHYFAHETPEGIDPTSRAEREKYPTARRLTDGTIRTGIAENIIKISSGYTIGKTFTGFVDPSNPEQVADVMMIEWINSPEHNKNLVDPNIDRIGVGVAYDGEYFFGTQNFY